MKNVLKQGLARQHCAAGLTRPRAAPDYAGAAPSAKELIRAAPERMLYAINWPHPSLKNNLHDDAALLDWVNDCAGSESVRQKIFVDNPARLYGF